MRVIDKSPRRAELEKLVNAYLEQGGEIRHRPGITLKCLSCHRQRAVGRQLPAYALRCRHCGARMRVA
jgi:hypothetical protein